MAAAYGLTPAGFVVKPLSQILADMQQDVWSAPNLGPDLDLSPQTPDGQILAIVADPIAQNWEMLQAVFNQYNREDAEGAALDNLGDIVGIPREGETYTQVYAVCALDPAHAPYNPGALVGNIAGFPAQTFTNVATVPSTAITGGFATVLFQATAIGPTPAINPGTLTVITTPVTGWTSITNPAQGPNSTGYTSLGQAQETDALYGPRQAQEISADGSCNPSATVAAIALLGAQQTPPVTLTATIYENTTQAAVVVAGLTIQPNQYAVFVYDAGTGWLAITANQQLVGQTIWNNRPSGNLAIGAIAVTIQDPVLGQQQTAFTIPTGVPVFINATVAILPGQSFSTIANGIKLALVAAAIAPTPSNGLPPAGQLRPGSPIIGSQLQAVIMSVPGVADVQALTFSLASFPTNTMPILIPINEVATILSGTIGSHINIAQGTYP